MVTSKLTINIPEIVGNINIASNIALNNVATTLLDLSNETVPFETGALKASGKVSFIDNTPENIVYAVEYTEDYAMDQYTNTKYHHPGLQQENPEPEAFKGRANWIQKTVDEKIVLLNSEMKKELKIAKKAGI